MCSVVGYIGTQLCKSFVLQGLMRLEYRGYDSAGFACIDQTNDHLHCIKAEGYLQHLIDKCSASAVNGFIGIGHTRWSTHGVVSVENAHPQFDCKKTLSVVHNGIIENHRILRQLLVKEGHVFISDTDTEVIAHLLKVSLLTYQSLYNALLHVSTQLQGAYAFVAILEDHPNAIIAMRKGSPLCIGIGNNEQFVASDVFAFADKTNTVLFVPDESFALVYQDQIELYDFFGNALSTKPERIENVCAHDIEKQGHEHFMLKEIFEQKNAIHKTVSYFESIRSIIWQQLHLAPSFVEKIESITLIGCGSSWHSALIAKFFFEYKAHIPVNVYLASEFRYMPFFPKENHLYICISQSGETADTLEVLRLINLNNAHAIVLTNVASSTIIREAQGALITHAGQEIAVASTKAFTTQIVALYWFAHCIALAQKSITENAMIHAVEELYMSAEILENSIDRYKEYIVTQLAPKYAQFNRFILLGRHISYPFALEATLKLKEISYVFASGYPAGELKHGPLALIDNTVPIFVFSSLDEVIYQKLLSNVHEIKSRGAHIIAFVFEGQNELMELADTVFIFSRVNALLAPLAMTGLMQFFFYHIAKVLGCNIDKPRNLAKSVTVE